MRPARAPAPDRPRRATRLRLVALAVAVAACVHDVHRVGPFGPAAPTRPGAVRILVFGDFGYRTLLQRLTARGMTRAHEARPFDLAIQLGDNIYKCGPDPTLPGAERCAFEEDGATVRDPGALPEDPIFRVNEAPLERLVGPDGAPIPIYLALGNHDVGWGGGQCAVPGLADAEATRRRACLSVGHRSPTWRMPARHYVVDRGPVRIVVVDTNVVVADYAGFTLEDEIAFVREATEGCGEERLCFVAGHHPPAAVHGYRVRSGASPYAARMARLVDATGGRALAFLAGHVHTLEHLRLDGLDVFVSGSTAMGGFMRFKHRTPARTEPVFVSNAWGHAELEADAEGWSLRFVDWTGDPLHCCAGGPAGPCRPVECR